MAKVKQIEFTPEFEKILTEAEEPRGVVLGRQPLRSVIQNSNANNKKKFLEILDRVPDLGKLSLNDFMADDKTKASMAILTKAMSRDEISAGDFKTFRGPMKNLLEQIGITAQGTTNPFMAQMKKVVAPAELKKLDAVESGENRLIPTRFSKETYAAVKDVGAKLKAKDTNVHLQYVLHLLGGYRPSDFKNLKLENINFTTGLVSNLDFKTDIGTEIKLAYFPQPQLDAIKSYLLNEGYQFNEERGKVIGKGKLFKNHEANSKVINDELKKTGIKNDYYQEKSKGIITKDFSVYDFRRLKETHLTNKGILPDDPIRKTLTWRAASGVVEKYTAGTDIGGALEDANAKSNATFILLGKQAGGDLTLAQYMSELGVDSKNIGGYTKRLRVLQSDLIKLPPDKLNFAEKNLGPMINTLPKEELSLSMEAAEINENAVSNYRQLAEAKVKTETLTEEVKQDDLTIKKAQNIPAVQQAQADLAAAKTKKKAIDLEELKNKGKNALDWITNNLGKPLAYGATLLGTAAYLREAQADFLKYKDRGFSDIGAGLGAGAETVRDVAVDTAVGLNVPRNIAQMSLIGSPAGEGADVLPAGDPQRMGMESESANFLNQMQSNLQPKGTGETQALNIIEQDTNIGNKMSTFGRTPDVSPGFVTPPSRSDLADETQRQQNFLGVN
jgi:integrase